jgi:hypothetical protein
VDAVQGDAFWTFMLNPPVVHPITWQSHFVPVFTNDAVNMGGHSSGHSVPQYSAFTGKAHLMGEWE